MKKITILMILAMAGCTVADNTSFEDLDVGKLKSDPERLQSFVECFVDESECDPIDLRLKNRAKDIIATNCKDCSLKEEQIIRDAGYLVITRKTRYLPKLIRKYDPGANLGRLLDSLTNVPSLIDLPEVSSNLLGKFMKLITDGAKAVGDYIKDLTSGTDD